MIIASSWKFMYMDVRNRLTSMHTILNCNVGARCTKVAFNCSLNNSDRSPLIIILLLVNFFQPYIYSSRNNQNMPRIKCNKVTIVTSYSVLNTALIKISKTLYLINLAKVKNFVSFYFFNLLKSWKKLQLCLVFNFFSQKLLLVHVFIQYIPFALTSTNFNIIYIMATIDN